MPKREPFCCGRCLRSALSLLLWRWTGDLRLYGWVQFFPCLALPLMFLLFPPKYTGTLYWIIAAALYALAKLFEYFDDAIYSVGMSERAYAQASRRGCRLLRGPEIFPDPPADRVSRAAGLRSGRATPMRRALHPAQAAGFRNTNGTTSAAARGALRSSTPMSMFRAPRGNRAHPTARKPADEFQYSHDQSLDPERDDDSGRNGQRRDQGVSHNQDPGGDADNPDQK